MNLLKSFKNTRNTKRILFKEKEFGTHIFCNTNSNVRKFCYIQGQYADNERKIREYFYYIDHQGMLFLDDVKIKNFTSCFKEKKFLVFFFSRLKKNLTDRHPNFPYVSHCGREINYLRCDDLPIVFTHVVNHQIYYNNAGDQLKENFLPQKVKMNIENGRVYHPAPEQVGGVGLIKSSLAIEFSSNFRFENGENQPPTHIVWQNQLLSLDNL